jgi:uncharacterized protein YyaL (SSP411 family)
MNRLAGEKSPYLLQHAGNPVDWHPWGEEAFARARSEDKPIFLSIGYATCHWCHVMARESFENPDIGAYLNEHFVAIKVDREERPDVDRIYMTALQAMGQDGGWPLSMFLAPDLRPFFGGTYFPPTAQYGRIGFLELLERVDAVWRGEREKVVESGRRLAEFLRESPDAGGEEEFPREDLVPKLADQLRVTYDAHAGGFGTAPKFPRPALFTFLLRSYAKTGSADQLAMVEHTMQQMAGGGIYDHLGGGFHRYSVDAEWRVPHFEKMLYDQAQIMATAADLLRITKNPTYEKIVRETAGYVLRDLTGPDGEFYSAEDADSPRPEAPAEHGEGAFYVWTRREILDLLGSEANLFCDRYGVTDEGNVRHDPHHEFTGRNILYHASALKDIARRHELSEEQALSSIERSLATLFVARSARPRPLRDDKVLASWNGLMISALARAAQALDDPGYADAAGRAARFLLSRLSDARGRLFRRYRDGEARFEGQLSDYAFVTSGLIDLYETTLETHWLRDATRLTELTIELFTDHDNGGFFDTLADDPSLLARMKERYDGAEPAGNAVMVMNLLRLSRMLDRPEWTGTAERTLRASSGIMRKHPVAMPYMIAAAEFARSAPSQVLLDGERTELWELLREIHTRYLPNTVLVRLDDEMRELLSQRGASFSGHEAARRGMAYLCEDFLCRLPTSHPAELGEQLDKKERATPA